MQWNSHGYDIAKWFANKFTHICPVWLQARLNPEETNIIIEGAHDIDYRWMQDVKNNNPNIKIGLCFVKTVWILNCNFFFSTSSFV